MSSSDRLLPSAVDDVPTGPRLASPAASAVGPVGAPTFPWGTPAIIRHLDGVIEVLDETATWRCDDGIVWMKRPLLFRAHQMRERDPQRLAWLRHHVADRTVTR